jgi:hypothetical protein
MNYKGLLAAALIAGPMAVQSQTLDFYDRVSGESATLLSGTVGPIDYLPLASAPFFGSVTGSITLDGSDASYDFTLTEHGGNRGPGIDAINEFTLSGTFTDCSGGYCVFGPPGAGFHLLTNSKGAITGATVNLMDDIYNGTQSNLMIGAAGVQAAYIGFIPGTSGYDCQAAELTNFTSNGEGTYTGPTIKNCSVFAGSAKAGHWSVTPEIDPASAAGGLALLIGGVLVLRSWRAPDGRGI